MEYNSEGLHAIFLVLSARSWFGVEDMNVVASLHDIFGKQVLQHILVVFTNGDHQEDERVSFEDFLSGSGDSSTNELKKLLEKCDNRALLFDNKSKDPVKQLAHILALLNNVDECLEANNGFLYTAIQFEEAKRATAARDLARTLADLRNEKKELKDAIKRLQWRQ